MKKPPKTIIGDKIIAISPTCHEKNRQRALDRIRPKMHSKATA